MIALIIGIVIGFLMCIPIGPINVWVINVFLRKNAVDALLIALGASLMDVLYFYVILSGLSLMRIPESFSFYFKLCGIFIIFLLGMKELLTKNIEITKTENVTTAKSLAGSIGFGIFIYTSNPTLFLTMASLGAFVKSLNLFDFTQLNISLISLGLGFGSFLWFVFLVKVVNRYKEVIRNKYLLIFARISGGLMIGLSLFMGHGLYFKR